MHATNGSDSTLPDIPLPVPPAWATARTPETPNQRKLREAAEYNQAVIEEVQRAARQATAMPTWFWLLVAPIFVVATIAASAAYPWGFAQ